jgi:hypothetical protein
MRNVSDESCREDQNRTFYIHHLFPEIRAVFEIMWKNKVVPDWPQRTVRRMRIVCLITKATDIHNECVIRIGFLLQRWLHKRPTMLRLYTVCLKSKCTDFPMDELEM